MSHCQVTFNQQDDDFCICIGTERSPFSGQFITESEEVLNDPVMDDHNSSRLTHMRMGIPCAGFTMGGPACMPNSYMAINRVIKQEFAKAVQFSCIPPYFYLTIFNYSYTRRIIAPIL